MTPKSMSIGSSRCRAPGWPNLYVAGFILFLAGLVCGRIDYGIYNVYGSWSTVIEEKNVFS